MSDRAVATTRVSVDAPTCARTGFCVRSAPQIFALPDDAETAIVIHPTLDTPELRALADEAEATCPTAAVWIE